MPGPPKVERDLLRFLTAGSVDDGKSTLIGRLLHDTLGVFEDQLDAVRQASKAGHAGALDLSLITDGLRAEREQGITIDVAYRYFATSRRNFIIADTPGHEQYTRNMATGASTAGLAVILLDGRQGVLPQSRRHAYIASLMGIRRAAVAVNKMDLVDFRREAFENVRADFARLLEKLGFEDPHFVPVSALHGDNVVTRSARTPWFGGPSLLEYLETVVVPPPVAGPLRFPVQFVIRRDGFRGYAGQVVSGRVRPGDQVKVLPSGLVSRVSSIHTFAGSLPEASPPECPAICLEDHLDVSRGDMLVAPTDSPSVGNQLAATLIWFSSSPLRCNVPYLLRLNTRQVCASIRLVRRVMDIQTMSWTESREVAANDITEVEIEVHSQLYFDPYRENRATGGFILIDSSTNATIAAGMILGGVEAPWRQPGPLAESPRVPAADHRGLAVWFTGLSGAGKTTISQAVGEHLTASGRRVDVLDGDEVRKHLSKELGFSREDRDENIRRIGFVAGLLTRNRVIVLVAAISPYRSVREEVRASVSDFLEVYVNAPLAVCEARDTKDLYRRARAGEIRGFTGIDDPYEPPGRPDVECHTDRETVEESVRKVLHAINLRLG